MKSIDLGDKNLLELLEPMNGFKTPVILLLNPNEDPFSLIGECDDLMENGVITGYGSYNGKDFYPDGEGLFINYYWFSNEEKKNLFIMKYL